MELCTGRVKWFSSLQHHGVLVGANGESLFFTSPHGPEDVEMTLAEGQLVSYAALGRGRLGPRAGNVHGLLRGVVAQPSA